MIWVTVIYANEAGKRFDMEYYASSHMQLVNEKLGPLGLPAAEVDKGLSLGGQPAPFAAAAYLKFPSLEVFEKAFAAVGGELAADAPNYTDIEPVVQVSEIV